jgi:hypothetical protein
MKNRVLGAVIAALFVTAGCGVSTNMNSKVSEVNDISAANLGNCLRTGDPTFPQITVFGETNGEVTYVQYKGKVLVAGGKWLRSSIADLQFYVDLNDNGVHFTCNKARDPTEHPIPKKLV